MSFGLLLCYREGFLPPKIRGHSRILAHSIQCAGWRGIDARVHIGTAVRGVSISNEHS